MVKTYNTSKSNTKSAVDKGGGGPDDMDISGTKTDVGGHLMVESSGKAPGGEGGGSEKSGAIDHNSTRSNRGASVGGGGTTGLKSTLGMMKSAFTLTTIIVLIAAGA
ncbi:uncharacterized protein METZ01_LOCUS400823, partial [marine metagenome]